MTFDLSGISNLFGGQNSQPNNPNQIDPRLLQNMGGNVPVQTPSWGQIAQIFGGALSDLGGGPGAGTHMQNAFNNIQALRQQGIQNALLPGQLEMARNQLIGSRLQTAQQIQQANLVRGALNQPLIDPQTGLPSQGAPQQPMQSAISGAQGPLAAVPGANLNAAQAGGAGTPPPAPSKGLDLLEPPEGSGLTRQDMYRTLALRGTEGLASLLQPPDAFQRAQLQNEAMRLDLDRKKTAFEQDPANAAVKAAYVQAATLKGDLELAEAKAKIEQANSSRPQGREYQAFVTVQNDPKFANTAEYRAAVESFEKPYQLPDGSIGQQVLPTKYPRPGSFGQGVPAPVPQGGQSTGRLNVLAPPPTPQGGPAEHAAAFNAQTAAHATLSDPKVMGALTGPTSIAAGAASQMPYGLGNAAATAINPLYTQGQQAASAFKAALSAEKRDTADKVFIPQTGDDAKTLELKAKAREDELSSQKRASGTAGTAPKITSPMPAGKPQIPSGYRKAPDGNYYRADPSRPGKYLMLQGQ